MGSVKKDAHEGLRIIVFLIGSVLAFLPFLFALILGGLAIYKHFMS